MPATMNPFRVQKRCFINNTVSKQRVNEVTDAIVATIQQNVASNHQNDINILSLITEVQCLGESEHDFVGKDYVGSKSNINSNSNLIAILALCSHKKFKRSTVSAKAHYFCMHSKEIKPYYRTPQKFQENSNTSSRTLSKSRSASLPEEFSSPMLRRKSQSTLKKPLHSTKDVNIEETLIFIHSEGVLTSICLLGTAKVDLSVGIIVGIYHQIQHHNYKKKTSIFQEHEWVAFVDKERGIYEVVQVNDTSMIDWMREVDDFLDVFAMDETLTYLRSAVLIKGLLQLDEKKANSDVFRKIFMDQIARLKLTMNSLMVSNQDNSLISPILDLTEEIVESGAQDGYAESDNDVIKDINLPIESTAKNSNDSDITQSSFYRRIRAVADAKKYEKRSR